MNLPRCTWIVGCLALLVATGCGKKPGSGKPVSDSDRKKAAFEASEGKFAMTIRNWAEAEVKFAKATELAPDEGDYWVSLGAMRKRQGNSGGAKDAYKNALSAFEAEAAKDKKDPTGMLQQIYVLALLGRLDDARALQNKAAQTFPENTQVKQFIATKQLDLVASDPKFKEMAL